MYKRYKCIYTFNIEGRGRGRGKRCGKDLCKDEVGVKRASGAPHSTRKAMRNSRILNVYEKSEMLARLSLEIIITMFYMFLFVLTSFFFLIF